MDGPSVQIQIILKDGNVRQVERMLASLEQAVMLSRDVFQHVGIYMSDCSKAQVLSVSEIDALRKKYRSLDIQYKFSSTSTKARLYNLAAQNSPFTYLVLCSTVTVFPPAFLLSLPGWFTDKQTACVEVRTIPWDNSSHFDSSSRKAIFFTDNCTVFRRDVFHAVGGFDDQHFPSYRYTADLSIRLLKEGYQILYVSDISVFQEAIPEYPEYGADDKKESTSLSDTIEDLSLLYKYDCQEELEHLLAAYKMSPLLGEVSIYQQFEKQMSENLLPLPVTGISEDLQHHICALCSVH